MRKRRILVLLIGTFTTLLLLIIRLMQIQLFSTEDFSKHHVNLIQESVKQRSQEFLIDDGRGQFLDQSGSPLSFEEKTVLILFPFVSEMKWDRSILANIIQIPQEQLETKIEQADVPFIFGELTSAQAEKVSALNIPGVYAINKKYTPNQYLAGQLIGVTGENRETFRKRYPDKQGKDLMKIGVSGLQESFDGFLLPEMPSKLIFHVDGIGSPLFGIDVKYTGQSNPYEPLNIKTTLNKQLQIEIEDILNKYNVSKGGALLMDVKTGNIIASASRPQINVKDPFSDEGTKNMMFKQQIPGSVFKTIIAAAAIEEQITLDDETFNCSLDIRGNIAKRDLGTLTLEESFSRSCNRTFAELAIKLQEKDQNIIEDYAHKLGMLGEIAWEDDVFYIYNFKQFNHDPGRVFFEQSSKKDPNYLAQTGIGQHEVRVSPVAMANMMATIARGGEKKSVRAATEILYGDGSTMFTFAEQKMDGERLSPSTIMNMQHLLRTVVTDEQGTGYPLRDLPYEIAGKSGTAETGIEDNGSQLYNKWFAGYFPFQNPQYVLVVVNLNVTENEGSVTPLFTDIVNAIAKENHIGPANIVEP